MSQNWKTPEYRPMEGRFVCLEPYNAESHGSELFRVSHGSTENTSVWTYLFYGPFASSEVMTQWYADLASHPDPLIWTVIDKSSGKPVGITALLNIVAEHGRAEIGHIWFTPTVHRTACNTEAQYLLLKHLFDELGYRRAEWKCNSLNLPSRETAFRMGFAYEGRFLQHMVIKGKNRDTDWFAMLDTHWPVRRENFERWLYSGEKLSLRALNQA